MKLDMLMGFNTMVRPKTILNQGTLILNLKKPKALEPQSSKAWASGPKLGLKAREPSPARKNSIPQYESATSGKVRVQNVLKGLQTVQFECPRHSVPSVSSISGIGKSLLSHY